MQVRQEVQTLARYTTLLSTDAEAVVCTALRAAPEGVRTDVLIVTAALAPLARDLYGGRALPHVAKAVLRVGQWIP
jgi:hypothetical protein